MVARCPKTLDLGVCVATASPFVGSRVPHVSSHGAIATQGETNVQYGIEGLKLLKKGLPPKTVLEVLLKKDVRRENRQLVIIDVYGRTAAFTGKHTLDWKGHIIGKDCVAAGNRLVSGQVLEIMVKTFESCGGSLAERLVKALEAGQAAGGDRLGTSSAALLTTKGETILDLRINKSLNPVRQLRMRLENVK